MSFFKQIFTWWHRQTVGTFIATLFTGKFIVKDEFGPIISPILMETVEKKLADGTLGYNDETRIDNIKQLDS